MVKKTLFGVVILAVLMTPLVVWAASHEEQETTLKGEPVDLKCFLQGRSGEGHAACATTCAKNGLPIGLLVKDGEESLLYLVMGGDNKPAKDHMAAHMGKQVKATGKVVEKNGLKIITVTKVEATGAKQPAGDTQSKSPLGSPTES